MHIFFRHYFTNRILSWTGLCLKSSFIGLLTSDSYQTWIVDRVTQSNCDKSLQWAQISSNQCGPIPRLLSPLIPSLIDPIPISFPYLRGLLELSFLLSATTGYPILWSQPSCLNLEKPKCFNPKQMGIWYSSQAHVGHSWGAAICFFGDSWVDFFPVEPADANGSNDGIFARPGDSTH